MSHSLILPFWAFICVDLCVTSTIYSHKKQLHNFISSKILLLYLLVHVQMRIMGENEPIYNPVSVLQQASLKSEVYIGKGVGGSHSDEADANITARNAAHIRKFEELCYSHPYRQN